MRQYRNHIQLKEESVGNERRIEMLSDIIRNGTFLPKTVEYKDIDDAFTKWVKEKLYIVSDEGKELPTMTLFSNQRFSEYTQSWEFTDDNKNIVLNFKTITRENNPQYGTIHGRLWNIPGDYYFMMKRKKVLDDNGTESYVNLKMKMPMAIDLNYKISIFCTKYQLINDFNMLINGLFDGRQSYLWPNNHPMAMTLENISDESSYQIDDRQFYGQTFNIKVMGYIITKEDYKIEEIPLKKKITLGSIVNTKTKADIEIDEDENELVIMFPSGCSKAKFTIDCDFETENQVFNNIKTSTKTIFNNNLPTEITTNGFTVYVNGNEMVGSKYIFKENDEIVVKIKKIKEKEPSMLKFL
jgi:hypothetical protein